MSTTPILDLTQEPPAPKSRKWINGVSVAVGGAIGLFLAITDVKVPLPGFNGLLWIPAFYLMICIHELGHLIAGKLTGMDPGGLTVGGFTALRSGAGWKFRFEWKRIFGGGLAVPLPRKGQFDAEAFAWTIAGGPAASIVSTLACWLAYLKYGDGEWAWIGSCFWAAALGLLSLIPMSAGMHKSDAARLWSLWRRPAESRAWMAIVAVQAENLRGRRPHEWDAELVEQMLAVEQPGSGRVLPELMAYFRCLDGGSESDALAHLEIAIASSKTAGKMVRQALFFEAAEANALLLRNAANGHAWLDRGRKLMKPRSVACAEGAVAMAENRFDDALRCIAEARAFLIKFGGDSGLVRFSKERLDQRERTCQDALSSNRVTASASA